MGGPVLIGRPFSLRPVVDLAAATVLRSAPTTPKRSYAIVRTAFVSTYPPRHCGIAAFTSDLAANTDNREVVALHPPEQSASPIRSRSTIGSGRTSRTTTSERPRPGKCVDVVSIQHEYGIWGGEDGAHVLDFVRALRVPSVTTLHTVLQHPTPGQRAVLSELVGHDRRHRRDVAIRGRSADNRLRCRPEPRPRHSARRPGTAVRRSDTVKPALGVEDRKVILSFGLLGPGKGYELALAALPDVVAAHPSVLYVVVGATHPDLVRSAGRGLPREPGRHRRQTWARRSCSIRRSVSSAESS